MAKAIDTGGMSDSEANDVEPDDDGNETLASLEDDDDVTGVKHDIEMEGQLGEAMKQYKEQGIKHNSGGNCIGSKYFRAATDEEMLAWVSGQTGKVVIEPNLLKKLCVCLLCEEANDKSSPAVSCLRNTSNRNYHLSKSHPVQYATLIASKTAKRQRMGIPADQSRLPFGRFGSRPGFQSVRDYNLTQTLQSVRVGIDANLPDTIWQNPRFVEGMTEIILNAVMFRQQYPNHSNSTLTRPIFASFKTRQKYAQTMHQGVLEWIQKTLDPVIDQICRTGVSPVSIITDIWTYHSRRFMGCYLAIPIGETNERKNIMIGFKEITDRHTGENLKQWLVELILRAISVEAQSKIKKTFDISNGPTCGVQVAERVVAYFCADGASNNKKTANLFKTEFIHCIAHRTNLCIDGGLGLSEATVENGGIDYSLCDDLLGMDPLGNRVGEEDDDPSSDEENGLSGIARSFQPSTSRAAHSERVIQEKKLRCKSHLGGHRVHLVLSSNDDYNRCRVRGADCVQEEDDDTITPGLAMYACFECAESYCVPCFMSTCHRSHPIEEMKGKDCSDPINRSLTCDFCQTAFPVTPETIWYGCTQCAGDPIDICVDCRGLNDLRGGNSGICAGHRAPLAQAPKLIAAANDKRMKGSLNSAHLESPRSESGGQSRKQNTFAQRITMPDVCQITDSGRLSEKMLSLDVEEKLNPPMSVLDKYTDELPRVVAVANKKIDNLYNLFRRSSTFSDLLNKIQIMKGMKPLQLLRSPPTRWTAWYSKVERYLVLHEAIQAVLHTTEQGRKLLITDETQRSRLVLSEAELKILLFCISLLHEPFQVMQGIQDPEMRVSVALWKIAAMRKRLQFGPFPAVSVKLKTDRYQLVFKPDAKSVTNLPLDVTLIRFRLLRKLEHYFGDAALSDLECGILCLDPRTRARIGTVEYTGPMEEEEADGEAANGPNEFVHYGADEETRDNLRSNASSQTSETNFVERIKQKYLFGLNVGHRGKRYLTERIDEAIAFQNELQRKRLKVLAQQAERKRKSSSSKTKQKSNKVAKLLDRPFFELRTAKSTDRNRPSHDLVDLACDDKPHSSSSNRSTALADSSSSSSSSTSEQTRNVVNIDEDWMNEVDMSKTVCAEEQLETLWQEVGAKEACKFPTSPDEEVALMSLCIDELYPRKALESNHTRIVQARSILFAMINMSAGSVIAESSFSVATHILGLRRLSLKADTLECKMMHKINSFQTFPTISEMKAYVQDTKKCKDKQ